MARVELDRLGRFSPATVLNCPLSNNLRLILAQTAAKSCSLPRGERRSAAKWACVSPVIQRDFIFVHCKRAERAGSHYCKVMCVMQADEPLTLKARQSAAYGLDCHTQVIGHIGP